jgi:hemerythrin-like domain-containing protein
VPDSSVGQPDILRALAEEHIYQLRVVRLLERQVAAMNQRQTPDYEVMHGVMRYMTSYPDRFHHPKEDLVFRKVMQRDPSARRQVQQLLKEHRSIIERGAELLAVIDRCRAEPGKVDTHAVRKAAHAYIGSLRRHMDVEMLRIFPRAQRVLRARDWAEIEARMKPILDPVFDATTPEFRTLRAEEQSSSYTGPRRAARPGWVEATALLESVSSLIIGATRASAYLSRHNNKALRTNAGIVRDLLGTRPLGERVGLVGTGVARNVEMAREINRRLAAIWIETFKAARRPYKEEGTYAALLAEAFGKLSRPAGTSAGTHASAAK